MEASPARPKPERPVSGIPVPTSRRASLNKATFGTAESSVTLGQHRDLLQLSQPLPGKNSPIVQQRRHSTLGSNDRSLSSPSMVELQEKDDPAHLKAQIAMLKSSLTASHQRIIALTSDINLDSSTSSMSPSEAGSRRPSTPMGGLADLSIAEEFTPTSEHDGGTNGNGEGEVDEGVSLTLNGSALEPESRIPRLPKSVPSYDLRSTAVTPSRPDGQSFRKVSEGPLGLSRIPQSTVTQALILHDSPQLKGTLNTSPTSGRPASRARSTYSPTPSPGDMSNLRSPYLGPDSPYSPAGPSDGRFSPALGVRKTSGGSSAASTRVIDSLQTELLNAKGHVDKLKQEVRSNQRVIGSLTRQTEDLKETKERMRMECEGLNNVIARKERLLQEVLERARTAESSLATHVANKKALEQSTKKSLQQMTSQLADAQAAQLKADREASSLRDGVKSLRDAWTRELKAVRDEVKQAEEKGRDDTAAARQSHLELVRLVEAQASERATITSLAKEAMETSSRANTTFTTHIEELKAQLDQSNRETSEAKTTAAGLAEELIRLRRLMREPKRLSLEDAAKLE